MTQKDQTKPAKTRKKRRSGRKVKDCLVDCPPKPIKRDFSGLCDLIGGKKLKKIRLQGKSGDQKQKEK